MDRIEYAPDGPEARRIAQTIPYYNFKGIDRFYDIGGEHCVLFFSETHIIDSWSDTTYMQTPTVCSTPSRALKRSQRGTVCAEKTKLLG